MKRGRRWFREERGSVPLEFALALPVLLIFILGILEIGFIRLAQGTLTAAVAQAIAEVDATSSGALTRDEIVQHFTPIANLLISDPENITLTQTEIDGIATTGRAMRVNVSYQWYYFTPLFAEVAGGDYATIQVSNTYFNNKVEP